MYKDFDIILTRLSPPASTDAVTAVPCLVVSTPRGSMLLFLLAYIRRVVVCPNWGFRRGKQADIEQEVALLEAQIKVSTHIMTHSS